MFYDVTYYLSIEGYRQKVTMRKNKNNYTTIQVSKEINKSIREFCVKNGLVASTLTERLWVHYISSSVSGSIIL